jgi:mannuronan synthase
MNLRGLLAYTGPTSPKAQKAESKKSKFRLRSVAVSVISLSLMLAAASVIYDKITQSYEPRPVFITRDGQEMRATTEGQIAYLNPNAKAGEVVFSINSNAGDVLNFQLPCECRVEVMEGIGVGTTVLPVDVILSFFEANVGLRVQTLMSAEGLAKAMNGEKAYLDINDGRTIRVSVVPGSATTAANVAGELYIPVTLVAEDGALTVADIGKAAQLRLSRDLFRGPLPLLDRILGRTS